MVGPALLGVVGLAELLESVEGKVGEFVGVVLAAGEDFVVDVGVHLVVLGVGVELVDGFEVDVVGWAGEAEGSVFVEGVVEVAADGGDVGCGQGRLLGVVLVGVSFTVPVGLVPPPPAPGFVDLSGSWLGAGTLGA